MERALRLSCMAGTTLRQVGREFLNQHDEGSDADST